MFLVSSVEGSGTETPQVRAGLIVGGSMWCVLTRVCHVTSSSMHFDLECSDRDSNAKEGCKLLIARTRTVDAFVSSSISFQFKYTMEAVLHAHCEGPPTY